MDENGNGSTPDFQSLRAKFEQQITALSIPPAGEISSPVKTKKQFKYTNHELTPNTVIAEWKYHATASTLKKCSSELIPNLAPCRSQAVDKLDFPGTPNDNNSNVQEIIKRLNNSNIPLTGSLINWDANESQSNASTSELSELSDEQPGKANVRPNMSMHNSAIAKQIIEEMKASGHFKKITFVRSKLPEEVGRVRTQRTRRMFDKLPTTSDKSAIDSWCTSAPISICLKEDPSSLEANSSLSCDGRTNPISLVGSSSISSNESVLETYEYYGKDADENRRCAELHGVVHEICYRQRIFLQLLMNICKSLVPFVKNFEERSNHKVFTGSSHSPHVLEKLSKHLEPIVVVHEVLCEEFDKAFPSWNALTPDFAQIFVKNADFLKICSGFLLAKKELTEELTTALEHNKHLAQAIRAFEDGLLNASKDERENINGSTISIPQSGGVSLVMHLDSVHQNVVRYILLMERYRKLLPPESSECEVADKAISKLKSVSQAINCSLDTEYTAKLMEIHRKVQGAFDILAPTRRLIHDGRLMKQTRKELQERHLVLFSDWILVCRYAYPWDYFDPVKTYRLAIKDVQTQIEDHVDHEREFALISPRKSSIFVTKSRKERDLWVQMINTTRNKWIESERKLQEQRQKLSVVQLHAMAESIVDSRVAADSAIASLSLKDRAPISSDSTLKAAPQHGPLWIPDSKATKCMMQECEVKFTKIRRRHHCRQCGYIMCSGCLGRAPVKVKNYECEKVCSHCFDAILDDFVQLRYFPPNMIHLTDPKLAEKLRLNRGAVHPADSTHDDSKSVRSELIALLQKDPFSDTIRIMYDNCARSMHPRDLFKEPANKHYRRAQTSEPVNNVRNSHETTLLISGKVHLSQKKGHTQVRWARLDNDFSLNFYEAELDAAPVGTFFIYGYSVFVNDNLKNNSGTEFTLIHQNQIKTERKDLKLVFRVENRTAADGWQDALLNKLELPQLDGNDIS